LFGDQGHYELLPTCLRFHIDVRSSLHGIAATDVDRVRRLGLALGLSQAGRAERLAFGAVLAADSAAMCAALLVSAKEIIACRECTRRAEKDCFDVGSGAYSRNKLEGVEDQRRRDLSFGDSIFGCRCWSRESQSDERGDDGKKLHGFGGVGGLLIYWCDGG
jgi:hypothetical protein